ncbi:uncharacterized protein LOC113468700 [Diaphorina citri]|uniref:Uncharacterized protein LOC113468700 n=1 Tax=Diaphorina citri TaxID=121845 RepID=A0A3Q0J4H0_DIACI|nr:uncharacterized protein LOC113468700 [Diaphorina citri]
MSAISSLAIFNLNTLVTPPNPTPIVQTGSSPLCTTARVNRHSTSFENYQQEQLNLIRRCKSLNNLESNQEVPCKVESIEDPAIRGSKSFLQSNLDLIEPPHFTSTPKKLPRPLEIYRRRSPAPRVTIANNEEEHNTTRSTDPPVSHWLRELSQRYDAEYMTALQSKALISEQEFEELFGLLVY